MKKSLLILAYQHMIRYNSIHISYYTHTHTHIYIYIYIYNVHTVADTRDGDTIVTDPA